MYNSGSIHLMTRTWESSNGMTLSPSNWHWCTWVCSRRIPLVTVTICHRLGDPEATGSNPAFHIRVVFLLVNDPLLMNKEVIDPGFYSDMRLRSSL